MSTYKKTPTEVLDFVIDWTAWLAGDTISSSSWAADTGITIDSDTNDTTSATVWLSGGTANTAYKVTNTVITAAGRTAQRTIIVNLKTYRES